jgi:hypothetical protein
LLRFKRIVGRSLSQLKEAGNKPLVADCRNIKNSQIKSPDKLPSGPNFVVAEL